MGRLFLENLDAEEVYCCKKCRTHFADKKQLISKVSSSARSDLLRISMGVQAKHFCSTSKYLYLN